MGKSQQTFNKKEREKKKAKKKKDKLERMEQRKIEKAERGKIQLEDQLMYLDENGNLTKEKPDPRNRIKVRADTIELGVPNYPRERMDTAHRGVVKFFSDEKGYGFITDKATKESIFVHCNDAYEDIKENHVVEFKIGKGPKGPKAENVVQIK